MSAYPTRISANPIPEGITCLGAVLGATLAGIDNHQEHDYVAMCEAWFNTRNGMYLVLNRQQDGAGGSFWHELFPHIVFYALSDRYPVQPRFTDILRTMADRWRQVCLDLADMNGAPDFNHLSFDFRTRKPVDNGKWREPDAAAVIVVDPSAGKLTRSGQRTLIDGVIVSYR